jgi:predicted lipid-binding transport protein (Tim44 family)
VFDIDFDIYTIILLAFAVFIKGETVETRFVAIDRSDITVAEVRGRAAQITVRFVSQVVSVTRDKSHRQPRRGSKTRRRRRTKPARHA